MNTERVFVNFQVETKKTKQIKEGDMITIRGKGRFFIKEIIGQTRSGRTILKVEKFVCVGEDYIFKYYYVKKCHILS